MFNLACHADRPGALWSVRGQPTYCCLHRPAVCMRSSLSYVQLCCMVGRAIISLITSVRHLIHMQCSNNSPAGGGPTTRHDNTTALALARSSAVTGNAMAGSRYSVCRLSRRWRLHDSIRCSRPSLLRAAPAPVRSDLLLYDRRGREHQLVLCTRTALHHAARVLLCETDLSTLRNTLPLNPVRTVTRRRLLDRRSAASTGRGDP